jgi:hypothetical protein
MNSFELETLPRDLNIDMPGFAWDFNNDTIYIYGKSKPENANIAWPVFIRNLKNFIKGRRKILIDFKLDYYNSSTNIYISDMFSILSANTDCRATVRWYYFTADLDTVEDAEFYIENNPYVTIELIERLNEQNR